MTGTPIRKADPHQNRWSSTPPTRGPIAAPAEKLAIQTPIANVRSRVWRNMLLIRDRVAGASVAPATPSSRAGHDQHLGAGGERGDHGDRAEGSGADQQQPAAADPVPERPERDQEPGEEEPVDVGDPQQLGAARLEIAGERRDRQVEHREVHRVEQAGQGDHREPDPSPAPSSWWSLLSVCRRAHEPPPLEDLIARHYGPEVTTGIIDRGSRSRHGVTPISPRL